MATRKDANRAAWDAAAKSTTEATLGLLIGTRQTVTNGVNVKSVIPKRGDAVLADADNNVIFVARDSYKALPDGWRKIGALAAVYGRKVLIAGAATAKKWSDVYQYIVTGWKADGADHVCAVTLHATPGGEFTYNLASTLTPEQQVTEFANQLNTWLLAHELANYHYSAYEEDGNVILQLDNYTEYQNTTSIAGLTLTPNVGKEIPETSSIYWDEKRTTYWAQLNKHRFYAYYKTNGRTPTANVQLGVGTSDPVNYNAFVSNEFCTELRNAYCKDASNPTDDDYKAYLAGEFPVLVPDMRGVLGPAFRDGKANTYKLAGKTYLAQDGTRKIKYLAADYCANYGFEGVKGFEAGDWYLPTMLELFDIIGPVTYPAPISDPAKADELNRMLKALGLPQIGNGSNVWTSCRYSTYGAWFYYGYNGLANYSYFYGSYLAVPVALYEIPEGNE